MTREGMWRENGAGLKTCTGESCIVAVVSEEATTEGSGLGVSTKTFLSPRGTRDR